jgi:hypothetical protein
MLRRIFRRLALREIRELGVGADVEAPGTYSFEFVINGLQGQGHGTLNGVTILNQPGPPLPLSWTIGLLPLIALVVFITVAWRRTKPGRQPLTV